MSTTPALTIPGVALGKKTTFIPSSKRTTWIDGHAVAFTKTRKVFYLIIGQIGTNSRMAIDGGPEAYELILTDAAREAILDFWRTGRRAWIEKVFGSGGLQDGRNDGCRMGNSHE